MTTSVNAISFSSLGNAPKVIFSRNNVHIKRVRALHQRAERDRTGLFFLEGVRLVAQAVEARARIETLVYSPPLLVHPFGRRLARELCETGVRCLEVAPDVLHSLALNDDPQGIAAVVRQKWEPLARVSPGRDLCWVALDTVQSPGNLGTILRTCDAVGAAGVILVGDAIDPFDPATVRATMGALFTQRFVRTTLADFLAWKRAQNCLLVGTSPAAPVDYQAARYPAPIVLWMGGERKGLPVEFQQLCDAMVRIPMVGRSDSLNLAVATSVLLYEVFNQRRRTGGNKNAPPL